MAIKLNLLFEKPDFLDSFEYLEEEANLKTHTPSALYIKGPYMGANLVNKNKRMYPIDELRREVQRYVTEMVKPGRAMGELNHPQSADVDLERACHLVTELYEDGDVIYGKSKVLTTPCGNVVRSLINDGVKVGMSSRALGTLEEGSSCNVVRNMRLVAIDCVSDPSYSSAIMQSIMENKQWILNDDGKFQEIAENLDKAMSRIPRKDRDQYLCEQIMKFLAKL